jgi:hypothetical protein
MTWDLVAESSLRTNSWDSAPTLIRGGTYPVHRRSSRIVFSSGALGVPGQSYALRLQVYVGTKLSDTVVVPSTYFRAGQLSRSLDRTFYPPATVPLVITNLALPSQWGVGSFPTVSVTVTNVSDQPATGQVILQVGNVGNPTPWKDPSYTFPLVTFAVPARTTRTVQDSGDPVLKSGRYELGVYVHCESRNGNFLPGDQVFARSRVTFIGAS